MVEPIYDQSDADLYYLSAENRDLKREIDILEGRIVSMKAEIVALHKMLDEAGL